MDDVQLKDRATGQIYTLTLRKPQHNSHNTPNPHNIDGFIRQSELIQPKSWADALKAAGTHLPGVSQAEAQKRLTNMLREQKLVLLKKNATAGRGGSHNSRQGTSSSGASLSAPVNLGPARKDQSITPPDPSPSSQPEITSNEPATAGNKHQGAQPVEQTETRGCPISMVTGEELLQLTDTTLPGPMPLDWRRTFRSGDNKDIGLGAGWTHSLAEYLTSEGQHLLYHDSEGRTIRFLCPHLHQKSRYVPEGLTIEARTEGFLLKQYGTYDKLFTRVGHSTHYRLAELHHNAYRDGVGFKIQLHHDSNNALTRIDGNWGKALLLTRDEYGHVRQIQLHNSHTKQSKVVVEYEYNAQRELVAQRNAAGVGEQYHFVDSQLKQRTLATGFSYYYDWDEENRCIRTWGDNGIYDYRFTWDPENHHSTATDSLGHITHFYYNDYGQIVEKKDPEGGSHRYSYHNGSLDTYTNPEGHSHTYFFDEQKRPLGERDALDNHHTLSYFQGRCNQVRDKSGRIWQYTYNRQGLIETSIDPAGRTTRHRYTPTGLLAETVALTGTTRYQWNDAGELQSLTLPNGLERCFHYNDWGQIVSADTRMGGAGTTATTRFEYTPTGLLSEIITPDGKRTNYTYNNNDQLVRYSDPRGRVTEFTYDGLSQVIERRDSEGHSLKYTYDNERNLVALTNENGERYEFTYDGNERLIKETGFDGRIQHYKYNAAGHLIKHLDSGTVLTEFDRDPLGRMTGKKSSLIGNKTGAAEISRYSYDALGRLLETYNDHQYLSFEYNAFGTLKSETHCDINHKRQRILSTEVTLRHNTHASGLPAALKLPNGESVRYQYNDQWLLQQVQWNGQQVAQFEHDLLGRERVRHQGALSTHTDYDPMGRLQQQRATNNTNKQTPIQRHYQYDEFGNLSQLNDSHTETRYVYDLLNRLRATETRSANAQEQEHFAFDPASNLLTQGENTRNTTQQQSPGNRLAFQGDRKFSYDTRGNLIQENRGKGGKLETRFEFNLQNQLVSVHKNGQTTHYRYDPLGRRISKQDTFGTTRYLWAGDQMVQETRNNISKTYVYEPGSFKPLAVVQNNTLYHYHLDHLGTPQELTNNEGNIVWKARYKTYGNVALKEVEDVENNLRFQGQYFDEETGLHYNRHRYYNPNTGQFISQDPIGLLGGVNCYQYAPNPTGWVDPFGLSCKEVSAAEESASYQGSDPYFGIDPLENISIKKGTKLAHITYRTDGVITGNYFTEPGAVEVCRAVDGVVSSKALNQGVQVYAGDGRTEYKKYVQMYEVQEDIPLGGAAFGKTKANPQFNPGRYKTHNQYFIKDDQHGKLSPVPGSLETMKNTEAPDISNKLNAMRAKKPI